MCYHLTKTYISSEMPKIKLGEFWITQCESFETQLIQFSHHVDLCFGINPKCTQLDLLTPELPPRDLALRNSTRKPRGLVRS